MPESIKAEFPIFSVSCHQFPSHSSHAKSSRHEFCILAAGGGGSSRSGVPNGIGIYTLNKDDNLLYEKTYSLPADSGAIMCMDVLENRPINNSEEMLVAVGIDRECLCYLMCRDSDADFEIKQVLRFDSIEKPTITDKYEELYQKACSFSENGEYLLTTGTDDLAKVWNLGGFESNKPFKKLLYSIKHKNLNDADISSDLNMVLSVSSSAIRVSKLNPEIQNTQAVAELDAPESSKFKFGRFISLENFKGLLSLEISKQKTSILRKWRLSGTSLNQVSVKEISSKPITCISLLQGYLIYGTSDGKIGLVNCNYENEIIKIYDKSDVHSFTVTSVIMVPGQDGEKEPLILSGSADYTLCATRVEVSPIPIQLYVILVLLIFVAIWKVVFLKSTAELSTGKEEL